MDFSQEREKITAGFSVVCGVDEVGRGPLAGPIMAAAVVLNPDKVDALQEVTDSKKISEKKREILYDVIINACHDWAIGEVSSGEIDQLGMGISNAIVCQRAVQNLRTLPSYIFLDQMSGFKINVPHETVIKGDATILSIAAASILAKVTRDRFMVAAAAEYPDYGFDRHKGYGSAAHLAAIKTHGPCPIHRMSFRPLRPTLL